MSEIRASRSSEFGQKEYPGEYREGLIFRYKIPKRNGDNFQQTGRSETSNREVGRVKIYPDWQKITDFG